jgi:hypothetical protein
MAGGVPLAQINHASTLCNAFPALEKEITRQSVYNNINASSICALQNAGDKRIIPRRKDTRPWYFIIRLKKISLIISGGSDKNLLESLSIDSLKTG